MWRFLTSFGQEKQIDVGAGLATLPTVEDALDADLQLTTAGTFYDAASVELPPGTWFLDGSVDCIAPSMASYTAFVAKIWNGTTAYTSGEQEANSGSEGYVRVSLSTVITVSVPTTIKLSVACDRSYASAGSVIKAATHLYGSGNHASKLTAVMLSPPTVLPYYIGKQELAHVEFTSDVSITGNSEGTANDIVTSDEISYTGEPIIIEGFIPWFTTSGSGATAMVVLLKDGSSVIGTITCDVVDSGTYTHRYPIVIKKRLVPAPGEHTYKMSAYLTVGTPLVKAGIGGAGIILPGYIRILRAA